MPMMSMMSVRPKVDKEVDVAVFAIVARAALPKISGVETPAVQISCSSPRAQPHAARGALSGFRAGGCCLGHVPIVSAALTLRRFAALRVADGCRSDCAAG